MSKENASTEEGEEIDHAEMIKAGHDHFFSPNNRDGILK
jgi:hypothetical protein